MKALMNNSRIKTIVLRRARFIRALRVATSGTVVAAVLALGSLYAIGREVWVARVIENMPSPANLAAFVRFFEVAFLNTTFVVQTLSLLAMFAVLWAAYDAAKSIHSGTRFA